jgi:hypothetical protein
MKIIGKMRQLQFFNIMAIIMLVASLSSCQVIGDIFRAGVWVGIIVVVLVIAAVFWLFRRIL